jgi:tight adherence protein B
MSNLAVAFYVLCFLAFYMLVEGLYYTFLAHRPPDFRRINRRLKRYASRFQAADVSEETSILMHPGDARSRLMRLLRSIPIPRRRPVELLLYRAGMPFTLLQFVVSILVLSGFGLLFGLAVLRNPLIALMLSTLGALPIGYVFLARRRRMALFEKEFPEALELLSRSLRVGHSLQIGFETVGNEMDDPIAAEFSHVADEISLGLDTPNALRNLAHRMNSMDMPFFINAILIQRETGGNLAEILDNLGSVVRERLQFYGRVNVLLKQGKMNANILAMLPPILLVVLGSLNPGYIAPMFNDELGRTLLFAGAFSVVLGFVICRRLADVRL